MSLETETARDILLDAFDDIVVHMDEETLGPSDSQTGLKAINRIMQTLFENGADLQFTKLENITDEITIPVGCMDALVAMLALRLWPKYRKGTPDITIVKNAHKGEQQMYKSGITTPDMEYPYTLPRGSGNVSRDSNLYNDNFYVGVDE